MLSPAAALEQPAVALDPRLTLRAATVAVGVTGGLWRVVNALGVPFADATATFAFGLALGLLQLAWAAGLVLAPSRRWLLVGAAATAASLLASAAVLLAAPLGRTDVVPVGVGLGLQLTFLLLVLAGAMRSEPGRVMRYATRGGLVTVALTMSVLVAGGAEGHAHPAGDRPEAGGIAPVSAPGTGQRSLLCHLI